jgi:hypothetical protein
MDYAGNAKKVHSPPAYLHGLMHAHLDDHEKGFGIKDA